MNEGILRTQPSVCKTMGQIQEVLVGGPDLGVELPIERVLVDSYELGQCVPGERGPACFVERAEPRTRSARVAPEVRERLRHVGTRKPEQRSQTHSDVDRYQAQACSGCLSGKSDRGAQPPDGSRKSIPVEGKRCNETLKKTWHGQLFEHFGRYGAGAFNHVCGHEVERQEM